VDCAVGLSCAGGACVSEFGEACVADADCGAEEICAGATCIPADDCAVTPDLRGEWTFSSTLSFDDALPPSTRALLDAVQAPLAFLTGDLPIDEPLLRVVATRLAAVIRDYARANLPDWFWPLLTFVGELDRALGTMEIRETVTLSPTEEMNHYRGPRRWEEVSVMIGGAEHQRRTEDIAGFGRDTSDTPVVALCGRFVMRRHAVEVGMGAVAAWAAKEAVRDATGGLFEIHEVVAAAARGFCQGVARATDGILPGDFQDMVEFACDSQIRRLSAALSDVLDESRMGTETMIVRGDGAIRSGNELSGGTWRATMAGSELSGDFVATR